MEIQDFVKKTELSVARDRVRELKERLGI